MLSRLKSCSYFRMADAAAPQPSESDRVYGMRKRGMGFSWIRLSRWADGASDMRRASSNGACGSLIIPAATLMTSSTLGSLAKLQPERSAGMGPQVGSLRMIVSLEERGPAHPPPAGLDAQQAPDLYSAASSFPASDRPTAATVGQSGGGPSGVPQQPQPLQQPWETQPVQQPPEQQPPQPPWQQQPWEMQPVQQPPEQQPPQQVQPMQQPWETQPVQQSPEQQPPQRPWQQQPKPGLTSGHHPACSHDPTTQHLPMEASQGARQPDGPGHPAWHWNHGATSEAHPGLGATHEALECPSGTADGSTLQPPPPNEYVPSSEGHAMAQSHAGAPLAPHHPPTPHPGDGSSDRSFQSVPGGHMFHVSRGRPGAMLGQGPESNQRLDRAHAAQAGPLTDLEAVWRLQGPQSADMDQDTVARVSTARSSPMDAPHDQRLGQAAQADNPQAHASPVGALKSSSHHSNGFQNHDWVQSMSTGGAADTSHVANRTLDSFHAASQASDTSQAANQAMAAPPPQGLRHLHSSHQQAADPSLIPDTFHSDESQPQQPRSPQQQAAVAALTANVSSLDALEQPGDHSPSRRAAMAALTANVSSLDALVKRVHSLQADLAPSPNQHGPSWPDAAELAIQPGGNASLGPSHSQGPTHRQQDRAQPDAQHDPQAVSGPAAALREPGAWRSAEPPSAQRAVHGIQSAAGVAHLRMPGMAYGDQVVDFGSSWGEGTTRPQASKHVTAAEEWLVSGSDDGTALAHFDHAATAGELTSND